MNLARVRQDITSAQQHFDYVESHATSDGKLMALVALQTARQLYTLAIKFPENYPNSMPAVHVRKPTLSSSPHRYTDDTICYLHPSMWNPGRHDLTLVIARTAKWLSKYEVYRANGGRWPGAEILH